MHVLVIGGAGMLGSTVARLLRDSGDTVRSFDLAASPDNGIESLIGDVRSPDALLSACAGMDAVIHTASIVNQAPGKPPIMYDINVQGTRNVIAACQQTGVPRLVYTSSIDVVFDGTPIIDGDETLPYPDKHLDYYSETKMLAEQAVIAANGTPTINAALTTCVIRAAGVYGPGDRHRFPRVIPDAARSGTYTRIGDGRSKMNHVYVDNVAYAHVLAAQQITPAHPAAGEAYFITDYAESNFFDFFLPFFDALGIPVKQSIIPAGAAFALAKVLEQRYFMQPEGKRKPPILTRYSVAATARDFWFNHRKAARDLGYAPIVSEADAFARTVEWTRDTLLSQ